MPREKGGNNRSRGIPGSYTHAGKHTAILKYSTIHGISQGEKFEYPANIKHPNRYELNSAQGGAGYSTFGDFFLPLL